MATEKISDEMFQEALKAVGTPEDVMNVIMESKTQPDGKAPPKVSAELADKAFIYSVYAMIYAHSKEYYELARKQIDSGAEVYVYFNEEEPFVYRPLMRTEFDQAMKQFDPSSPEFEEFIVSKCVVIPKLNAVSLKAMKSGLISTLAKLIMVVSGFDDTAVPISMKL
jgi:hypothetical protein